MWLIKTYIVCVMIRYEEAQWMRGVDMCGGSERFSGDSEQQPYDTQRQEIAHNNNIDNDNDDDNNANSNNSNGSLSAISRTHEIHRRQHPTLKPSKPPPHPRASSRLRARVVAQSRGIAYYIMLDCTRLCVMAYYIV